MAFAAERGGPAVEWVGLAIEADGEAWRVRNLDPYGRPGAEDQRLTLEARGTLAATTTGRCTRLWRVDAGALVPAGREGACRGPAGFAGFSPAGLVLARGAERLELRRARPFACWAAVPRADGSWWSARDLPLHDQGGRVALATDENPPQRFGLKMRRVAWESGPNRPSLVLYVHTPAGGERAVAYAWADQGAERVGLNIRALQASCTRGQDATSAVAREAVVPPPGALAARTGGPPRRNSSRGLSLSAR